jgi:hypothetical protein
MILRFYLICLKNYPTCQGSLKARVLKGLGFINQALYLVPRFFQHKPASCLIAPRVTPAQLNDDALGRALDTFYAYGITAWLPGFSPLRELLWGTESMRILVQVQEIKVGD